MTCTFNHWSVLRGATHEGHGHRLAALRQRHASGELESQPAGARGAGANPVWCLTISTTPALGRPWTWTRAGGAVLVSVTLKASAGRARGGGGMVSGHKTAPSVIVRGSGMHHAWRFWGGGGGWVVWNPPHPPHPRCAELSKGALQGRVEGRDCLT